MKGNSVIKQVGYPNEMQVREAMIQACDELGSKAAFCEKIGLSRRYFDLIMEWKRAPVHWKILQYFGWHAVYAVPEDLLNPPHREKPGRKQLSINEKIEKHIANTDKRRAYWRRKQREYRERRRQIHSL